MFLNEVVKDYCPQYEVNRCSTLEDLAWFLGATASDGHVKGVRQDPYEKSRTVKNGSQGGVIFSQKDNGFVTALVNRGSGLFGVTPRLYDIEVGGNPYTSINFNSIDLAMYIGDLRGNQWHETIYARFKWALQKPYVYHFLSGFFDGDGSVSDPRVGSKRTKIRFTIGYTRPALFLLDVLRSIGYEVTYPSINDLHQAGIHDYDETVKQHCARGAAGSFKLYTMTSRVSAHNPLGIKEIVLCDTATIQRFSHEIRSTIAEKERRLEKYRRAQIYRTPADVVKAYECAMDLRNASLTQAKPLGAGGILKHPSFQEHLQAIYGFSTNPRSLINNWVHAGNDPRRSYGNAKGRIVFQ